MIELIEKGTINKYSFLLENYKSIKITDSEVILILHIIRFKEIENFKLSFNDFIKFSSMKKVEIEKNLDSLVTKKLLKITFSRVWKIDLTNLWNEIINYLENYENIKNLDLLIKLIEKIIEKKLDKNQTHFITKIVDVENYERLKKIIKELSEQENSIAFDTIEKLILMELENKKEKKIIKYNWLRK